MGEAPGGSRRFTYALALIALGALVLRVVYLIVVRDRLVLSDGFHYHQGALWLADGRGFINPLAFVSYGATVPDAVHPPAWESLLAAVSLVGVRSVFSHQIVAALVGTGAVVTVGLTGREAFGSRAGLIAAAIAGVYANFWQYERDLMSEPLALLAVALVMLFTYKFRARPGIGFALALGAAVGLAAMTRAELILLGPLVAAPVVLARRTVEWPRRLGWLASAAAVCVVLMLPWAIYNTTRFDRFVPLSTNAGATMLAGNCPATYEGDLYAYYDFDCLARAGAVSDDPSIADGQYRTAAVDFMRENTSEAPVVALARAGRMLDVYRPFQQSRFETERGGPLAVLQVALVSYWILAPLAVVGFFVARRRRLVTWPLLVPVLIVVVTVLPSIGTVRYRAPAEVSIVLLAALSVDGAWRWWTSRRTDRREAVAGEDRVERSDPDPDAPVEVSA
jgi:4-amino-4-deoxy-L-arabinose transferase-like glycosyltransferase